MSTYPFDTKLSKASGACLWHLSRAGQVAGADFKLLISGVDQLLPSNFFGGPPPRLKSWIFDFGTWAVSVGDKSGLVVDWSR